MNQRGAFGNIHRYVRVPVSSLVWIVQDLPCLAKCSKMSK